MCVESYSFTGGYPGKIWKCEIYPGFQNQLIDYTSILHTEKENFTDQKLHLISFK